MDYTAKPDDPAIFEAYKKRSFLLGQEINILYPGKAPVPAVAVGLDEDYSLLTRLGDGSIKKLSSAQVLLSNGVSLPVSSRGYADCKRQYLLWKGRDGWTF